MEANISRYSLYKKLAERETARKAVYFCGRLATYSYLDMDQTVENALQLYQVIKGRNAHAGALGRSACLQSCKASAL